MPGSTHSQIYHTSCLLAQASRGLASKAVWSGCCLESQLNSNNGLIKMPTRRSRHLPVARKWADLRVARCLGKAKSKMPRRRSKSSPRFLRLGRGRQIGMPPSRPLSESLHVVTLLQLRLMFIIIGKYDTKRRSQPSTAMSPPQPAHSSPPWSHLGGLYPIYDSNPITPPNPIFQFPGSLNTPWPSVPPHNFNYPPPVHFGNLDAMASLGHWSVDAAPWSAPDPNFQFL